MLRLRPLVVLTLVLSLATATAPAFGYTLANGAFTEHNGGSGGRTANGVHPTAGAVTWDTTPAGEDVWEGPVLLDRSGHVLAFTDIGTGDSQVVAFDLGDGRESWRSDEAEPVDFDCVSVALDGTIWAQSADGDELLGLDPSSGAVAVRHAAPATGCDTGLQILPGNQMAYLDFCCSERLHVVDLDDGHSRELGGESLRDDFLLTSPDGERAYVVTTAGDLLSLDLTTGAELDRFTLDGTLPFRPIGSSAVRADGAIVMSLESEARDRVVRIDDDGEGTLSLGWLTFTDGPVGRVPSWLVFGGTAADLVIGWQRGDDTLLALDSDTGELVYRSDVPEGPSGGVAFASLIRDGVGNVIIPQALDRFTTDGDVLYDVLSPAGVPIGRAPYDLGRETAGMVLADDGTLVIRTAREDGQHLIALSAGTPGLVEVAPQVDPVRVGAGVATLTVTGTIVADAAEMVLVRGTDARRATAVHTDRRNPIERQGRFDLRGAEVGDWSLQVVDGSGVAIDTGLQVRVDPPDDKATLRVDLQQPSAVRNGRVRPVSVTVTNTSNIDADVVPVVVNVALDAGDVRSLDAAFDVLDANQDRNIPDAAQLSSDSRTYAVTIPWVPADGSVTLPFLLDVPADAPDEGVVDIVVGAAACVIPSAPVPVTGPSFAQVGRDPCLDEALTGTASGALDPATASAAQCVAVQLAAARAPRVEGGVIVIPDEPVGSDLPGLARSCFVDALEEVGGVSHPIVTIFKVEAFALAVTTAYLDCSLSGSDSSDSDRTLTGSSVDPNEIDGPAGVGEPRYLAAVRPLDYRISFENLADAAFAAQTVEVTTTLDPGVDPESVAVGAFGWGGLSFSPPPVSDGYTAVLVPDAADHRVRVTFSRAGRELAWRFETLSLVSDEPPENDEVGFLPPNVAPPQGDGFVSYSVDPVASIAEGAIVQAVASIVFDTNDPIITNTWSNTFDLTAPTTVVTAPASPSPSNTVEFEWVGSDATSGVVRYLVQQDDGPVLSVDDPSMSLIGGRGDTIRLRVRAVDGAGNIQPEPAEASVTVAVDALDRLFGPTRIGTAIDISTRIFGSSGTAVLARADTYPDSLAGATLAHDLRAPLLLTNRDSIPQSVLDELRRLGVRNVVVLGGTAAVGDVVVASLQATGFVVERVFGGDRFATAAAVADLLPTGEHAFIAAGRDPDPSRGWPEALQVAPWAAQAREPLLLVEGESLPPATREALVDRGISRVTVVGSAAEVSTAIVDELESLAIDVTRIEGVDRYAVGLAVASAAVEAGAGDRSATWLATGLVFADALSAGAAVAATGGTLLLVDGQDWTASRPVVSAIGAGRDTIEVLRLAGGPAAIAADAEMAIRAALRG